MKTEISMKNFAFDLGEEREVKRVTDKHKIGFPNKIAHLDEVKHF